MLINKIHLLAHFIIIHWLILSNTIKFTEALKYDPDQSWSADRIFLQFLSICTHARTFVGNSACFSSSQDYSVLPEDPRPRFAAPEERRINRSLCHRVLPKRMKPEFFRVSKIFKYTYVISYIG